ncbi:alginate lyase-domain-containing protein [Mycena maculata]|uniref:Alginate lyase-domain-containing protein n=1 Tax=Mycena maculata TaxID=230809 RepID=A0AAD7JJV2_9AGAR|nr:alginate lyase-domain-containing protein [Mycena maculata]
MNSCQVTVISPLPPKSFLSVFSQHDLAFFFSDRDHTIFLVGGCIENWLATIIAGFRCNMYSTFLQRHLPRPQASFSLCLWTNLLIAQSTAATNVFTSYANDFVDPTYAAAGQYPSNLGGAQDTIVAWANEMNSYGPWSVTDKPVVAPSGNKHDYMSWAPYQWPDCSHVGNKTILTPQQIWTTCPYVFRDGLVNPDRTTIDDFQSFFNLSDAVLYNALAFTFQNQSSSVYSQNIVKFINTWFLDTNTSMNPNLNYAQMNRGPNGQTGEYTGILDLRGFAKIASGILILRKRGSSDWTADIDSQMVAWCEEYISWLQTAPMAKQAATAKNNHGTFYVNQLAALKLIVNDMAGAIALGRGYFGGIYKGQIASNGNQPLEASRSRPYHYRNFNIAGMITNARLLKYADPTSNDWNTTSQGATIQTAVDFLMMTNPSATSEANVTAEIYPNVAAIAATYGDPTGKYVQFLNSSGFPYGQDASFLWDQPLAGGTTRAGSSNANANAGKPPSSIGSSPSALSTNPAMRSERRLPLLSGFLVVLGWRLWG